MCLQATDYDNDYKSLVAADRICSACAITPLMIVKYFVDKICISDLVASYSTA